MVSKWGAVNLEHECGLKVRELHGLVSAVYGDGDMTAPISSGSFRCDAMLIAPCSARTLGAIASGSGDTLISRAADVALKERRRLVLALREAPLSSIHLQNALRVSDAGGIVYPLVPTFYAKPLGIEELVDQIAARLVDLCGIETSSLPIWGESVDLGQDDRRVGRSSVIPGGDDQMGDSV